MCRERLRQLGASLASVMVNGSRIHLLVGLTALLVGVGLATVPTEPVSAAAAQQPVPSAPLIESDPSPGESTESESTERTEVDRPDGSAWIIGLIVFVLAVVLIAGGRWWVRNRVGSVQR